MSFLGGKWFRRHPQDSEVAISTVVIEVVYSLPKELQAAIKWRLNGGVWFYGEPAFAEVRFSVGAGDGGNLKVEVKLELSPDAEKVEMRRQLTTDPVLAFSTDSLITAEGLMAAQENVWEFPPSRRTFEHLKPSFVGAILSLNNTAPRYSPV